MALKDYAHPLQPIELTLFPASQEQIIESRRRTHAQWGRGLSAEAYLARDMLLDRMNHASAGKLVTWILAPRGSPDTLSFLCACETFKRDAIIAHDSSVADSAEDVVAYGVASVFTPAPYRRYGYAKHMMRLLHWVLANLRFREATIFPKAWGTPPEAPDNVGNAAFSVLYSDVGAQFYESCGPSISVGGGWSVKSPVSTLWRLKAQETHESLDLGGNMVIGEWRMLRLEDLNHVWEKDAGAMRANLAKRHTTGRSPFLCAFLPSQGVTAFQIQRLVDTTARGNPLPGDTWGIENIEDGAGGPVFASWTVELKGPGPKSLVVTRLRVRPDRFPDLLKLISAEARQFEAEVIEVWNLDTELVNLAHQLGGRTIMREEHLPSLAWYGPNATADVNWAYNERFCWC